MQPTLALDICVRSGSVSLHSWPLESHWRSWYPTTLRTFEGRNDSSSCPSSDHHPPCFLFIRPPCFRTCLKTLVPELLLKVNRRGHGDTFLPCFSHWCSQVSFTQFALVVSLWNISTMPLLDHPEMVPSPGTGHKPWSSLRKMPEGH